MRKGILIALLAGFACACTKNPLSSLPSLTDVRANLAFTCVHQADHLPPLDPEADQLFKYARYLQTQDGPKDFDDVARYYRIAAAHGHYKANSNLQELVSVELAHSPDAPKEAIDLAVQLVKEGVPGGYYDIGHYLEVGYGLKQNSEAALRYFRKAADLGSPDGQYYVGKLLFPIDKAPKVAREMWRCAADQGHSRAALELGIDLTTDKLYDEGVKAFQQGASAGNRLAASFLEQGFNGPSPSDRVDYIGVQRDPERSHRYKLIGKFLDDNDGRNPKVPDIDKIVPLPPAVLPPWDGTFQWEKDRAAAVPPPTPSDELVGRLAKAKDLDPATGLPLPKAEQVSRNEVSGAGLALTRAPAAPRPL